MVFPNEHCSCKRHHRQCYHEDNQALSNTSEIVDISTISDNIHNRTRKKLRYLGYMYITIQSDTHDNVSIRPKKGIKKKKRKRKEINLINKKSVSKCVLTNGLKTNRQTKLLNLLSRKDGVSTPFRIFQRIVYLGYLGNSFQKNL